MEFTNRSIRTGDASSMIALIYIELSCSGLGATRLSSVPSTKNGGNGYLGVKAVRSRTFLGVSAPKIGYTPSTKNGGNNYSGVKAVRISSSVRIARVPYFCGVKTVGLSSYRYSFNGGNEYSGTKTVKLSSYRYSFNGGNEYSSVRFPSLGFTKNMLGSPVFKNFSGLLGSPGFKNFSGLLGNYASNDAFQFWN